ncbi:MAG: biotin/lipoyl-containing protein [Gemmatimonas sp.]
MKYIVDVNGERIAVELDGTHAIVDGESMEVALTIVDGTPMRLVRVGEQVHRVVARRGATRGRWTLDVDGARVETEALDERMRTIRDLTAASAVASGPAPLLAPMPGLVVRVNVAPGDTVVAGQGLVVVEAMKMENELRAAAPGVVLSVRAVAGLPVEKGAVLVELGPLPDEARQTEAGAAAG